jgi:hypothetical protein
VEEREERTETERVETRPEMERERRPETERRENCERDVEEREELGVLVEPEPEPREPEPLPPGMPVTPVGVEPIRPWEETTGARPQVSQYSSPPPTSS